MSKQMDENELEIHCNTAIAELGNTLSEFRISQKKRAMLIAYWLKSYAGFLRKEDAFDPVSVFRLKRGSIIRVEFGYKIGRELGGRHYAVVVDAENALHRNTVTVVPLGSLKENSKENRYCAHLEDGIFVPIENKVIALINEIDIIIRDTVKFVNSISKPLTPESRMLVDEHQAKLARATKLGEQANIWLEEISHMQQGTIANVDQITTISKMRISQPLQKTHPLYNMRLTPRDMDKIDDCIKELYFSKMKDA